MEWMTIRDYCSKNSWPADEEAMRFFIRKIKKKEGTLPMFARKLGRRLFVRPDLLTKWIDEQG